MELFKGVGNFCYHFTSVRSFITTVLLNQLFLPSITLNKKKNKFLMKLDRAFFVSRLVRSYYSKVISRRFVTRFFIIITFSPLNLKNTRFCNAPGEICQRANLFAEGGRFEGWSSFLRLSKLKRLSQPPSFRRKTLKTDFNGIQLEWALASQSQTNCLGN